MGGGLKMTDMKLKDMKFILYIFVDA